MATLNSKTWDIVPRADGKLYMEDGLASSPGSWTSRGAWVTLSLLRQIPQSGAAWTRLEAAALGDWGTADLSALDNDHDVLTLAGALYAAVTDDVTVRTKVVNALHEAVASPLATVLELARGMQSYVLAADIIAHRGAYFYDRVAAWVDLPLNGHSTANSLRETAQRSANNWGGHSRASLAAAALYLEDATMLADVVQAHEEFIGTYAGGSPQMIFTDTAWHYDALDKAGVNRLDAGVLSGVLPEEWRRDTLFDPTTVTTLADLNAVDSIYLWEGIQGFIVTAVLLHRYGAADITDGDNAVERALDVLVNTAHPALGDDRWIPFLANEYIAGATYDESAGIQEGKGMGWTDFTSLVPTDPYDLSGFSIPHTVTWPTAPQTNQTINVPANDAAALASAVQTTGARVVVAAGTYVGNVFCTADDVDVVCNDNVFIVGHVAWGDIFRRARRIRWTGGNMSGGLIGLNSVADLLVNDFYMNTNGALSHPTVDGNGLNNMSGGGGSSTFDGWQRVAFINSTIDHINGDSAGGWCWFSQCYSGSTQEDLILANVKMTNQGGQTNRFQSVDRMIAVDFAFNHDYAAANGCRVNYSTSSNRPCNQVFFGNGIITELFQMDYGGNGQSTSDCLNGTFDSVYKYNQGSFYDFATQLSGNTGVVRNCRGLGVTGSPPGSLSGISPMTDGGGNDTAQHSGAAVSQLPDGTLITAVGAIR